MRTIDITCEQYPLFSSLGLETGARCNRHCVFCPNHDFVRPDQFMPIELVEKALSELGQLKYKGRLALYIYNEPLRDKRMVQIIKMARKLTPKTILMLNTNCDFLNEKLLDALFEAGLNQLALNIYSADDGKEDAAVVKKGIEKAKERAATIQGWLDKRPYIDQTKSLYSGGSAKCQRARVQHKYGVQKDGTNFGGGYELQNRSGNVAWLQDTSKKTYEGVCTRPFRVMQVNWKGETILCCNDYQGETATMNIKTHSLVEMWNSSMLNRYRSELQDGVRKGICTHCNFKGGAYKHMINRVTT